jgi:hypothetical protein
LLINFRHPTDDLLRAEGAYVSFRDLNIVSAVLKFGFSWLGMMPAAIAISGIFIRHIPGCQLTDQKHHLIGIPLWPVYRIRATGDEVVFGIGLFIAEFFLLGLTLGRQIYAIVRSGFGLDLGQFNSICAFSAFSSVLISFLALMIYLGGSHVMRRTDPALVSHTKKIGAILARDEIPRDEHSIDPPAAARRGR